MFHAIEIAGSFKAPLTPPPCYLQAITLSLFLSLPLRPALHGRSTVQLHGATLVSRWAVSEFQGDLSFGFTTTSSSGRNHVSIFQLSMRSLGHGRLTFVAIFFLQIGCRDTVEGDTFIPLNERMEEVKKPVEGDAVTTNNSLGKRKKEE